MLRVSTMSRAQWQAKCEAAKGARLASINNAQEQAAAAVVIKAGGRTVLIGMKRIAPGKHFINGAGIKLPYSNWNAREPSNWRGQESCVEVHSGGKWNDVICCSIAALCEVEYETVQTCK